VDIITREGGRIVFIEAKTCDWSAMNPSLARLVARKIAEQVLKHRGNSEEPLLRVVIEARGGSPPPAIIETLQKAGIQAEVFAP